LVIAVLIGLLWWDVRDAGRGRHLVSDIRAGRNPVAPAFDLPVVWPVATTWPDSVRGALRDNRVSLGELRGYPVVLNVWASWCGPCKAEAPRLIEAAIEHRGEVVFLGLDVQDFKSDARRFSERYGVNYVSVRDGGASTYEAYGLTGLPETYFIDARGRIRAHVVGEMSVAELEAGITAATDEESTRQ
jgi:cytochrome c biogenesis protein CcmG, thiol:disulfide interchange protein DsbE